MRHEKRGRDRCIKKTPEGMKYKIPGRREEEESMREDWKRERDVEQRNNGKSRREPKKLMNKNTQDGDKKWTSRHRNG